jgi:hypothetical protein
VSQSNAVDVAVDFLLRDSLGSIEARFDSSVEMLVVADLA